MGREALVKSMIAGSLLWNDHEERPIDRITAVAYARQNEVGAAMLRVEALDAAALRKVILLIVRRLNHKFHITRGFAERMAFAVLHEYYRPNCIFCGGKGEIHPKANIIQACPNCSGTGLHHYTDRDRVALVGGKYNQDAYENAMAYIRDSLAILVRDTNRRLGE